MTARANPIRGEAEFTIAGQTHILRPSFENLIAAEEELGSLFALVERASEGVLTLQEIAALIWHCLDSTDMASREAVGETVVAMGLVQATKPVRAILAQVLQGQV